MAIERPSLYRPAAPSYPGGGAGGGLGEGL